MPFSHDVEPHVLTYRKDSGYVRIDHITNAGAVDNKWASIWTRGWTSFAPFDRGAQARYVAYKSDTGEVDVDAVRPSGAGVTNLYQTGWSTGWHVYPVRLLGLWYTLS